MIPSRTLDWLIALPGSVTYGGGNNGTYWNSSGYLVMAKYDLSETALPSGRRTWDPVTLDPLGLLVEEQRENLQRASQNYSTEYGKDHVGVADDVEMSPEGLTNADLMTGEDSPDYPNTAYVNIDNYQSNASLPFVVSGIYKGKDAGTFVGLTVASYNNGDGRFVQRVFDLDAAAFVMGNVGPVDGVLYADTYVMPLNNGYTFFAFTGLVDPTHPSENLSVLNNVMSSLTNFSVDNRGRTLTRGPGGRFMAHGIQLEHAPDPSSYIYTTYQGTRVRSADTATSASDGAQTIRIRARTPISFPAERVVWSRDDGTVDNSIVVYVSAAGKLRFRVTTGGVSQCDVILGDVEPSIDIQFAVTWSTDSFRGALGDGAVVADSLGTVPTVTTDRYGYDGEGLRYWMSTIKTVEYYDDVASDAELAALASGLEPAMASLDATLGALTLTATALAASARLNATLAALTTAAAATVTARATLSRTLAPMTVSAIGVAPDTGMLSSTLAALTVLGFVSTEGAVEPPRYVYLSAVARRSISLVGRKLPVITYLP